MDQQAIYGIIGAVITVVSGVCGTIFETRQHGRPTAWAGVAIFGILSGVIIGQFAEANKREEEQADRIRVQREAQVDRARAEATRRETLRIRAQDLEIYKKTTKILGLTSAAANKLEHVSAVADTTLSGTRKAAQKSTLAAELSRTNLTTTSYAVSKITQTASISSKNLSETLASEHDIGRLMYPWKNITAEYQYTVLLPQSRPYQEYEERLKTAIADYNHAYEDFPITAVDIWANSPLIPSSEEDPSGLLLGQILRVAIYRKNLVTSARMRLVSADNSDFLALVDPYRPPGPHAFGATGTPEWWVKPVGADEYPFFMQCVPQAHTCTISMGDINHNRGLDLNGYSYLQPSQNPNLQGLNDLVGGEIVTSLLGPDIPDDRSNVRLQFFKLKVGDQTLYFGAKDMLALRTPDSALAYVWKAPPTLSQLLIATQPR